MLKSLVPAAVLFGCAFALGGSYRTPYPGAGELRQFAQSGGEDAAFVGFGMRKLGADINFIRLLQYYGSDEEALSEGDSRPDALPNPSAGYGGGVYAEFLPRLRHIISLDPYFKYASLYGAGVLAFNLERPEEALSVLEEARQALPDEWQFSKYIAAIGYRNAREPEKVADLLDPIISLPDAPAMLKQQAAFLNKRIGRLKRAHEIYADIAATSVEKNYVDNARKNMRALGKYAK